MHADLWLSRNWYDSFYVNNCMIDHKEKKIQEEIFMIGWFNFSD